MSLQSETLGSDLLCWNPSAGRGKQWLGSAALAWVRSAALTALQLGVNWAWRPLS